MGAIGEKRGTVVQIRYSQDAGSNPDEALDALATRILPDWVAHRDAVAVSSAAPEPIAVLQRRTLECMDETALVWREYLEGAASGDRERMNAALSRKTRINQSP
jgi:hypothetical protein